MSEMTLITKRYSDIVDFTSRVNKSVIVFKKKSLLADKTNKEKYPKLDVSDDEINTAKKDLLQSLSDLESLAKDTEYNSKLIGLSESSALQNMVLRNDTDRKEIEVIVQLLKENKPLTKANFLMLDKIIAILDSERNLLFRKMRTARG
ncbi:hypothetical protein SAMN05444410_101401 [Hydrobacter penzbergensis]|uniref:Uncharacterized protein n=1 Tax=Hydrobacter penzbergensis TaxID=1235997 RepID=A0A8X8I8Y0_9BACT|nr:hypothetical protein [Hydrobacter penzbergensis]SDW16798.1 hypothetical protein SAMN05444410_101401 [Hydrobacter penzbergensis]